MNWQTVFAFSDTANWILLTAFHSLWLSLVSFLTIHFRKFRSPVVRSTWCTCMLILLLALPLINWFIPRMVVRAQPAQTAAVMTRAPTVEIQAPLVNRLLDIKTPLPQPQMNQWKVRMNQFGFLWLAVTLICVGRLLDQLAFLRGYCTGLQEIQDGRISAALKEIKHTFYFRKKPRFFVSHKLRSPISTGIRTPLIVLPASLYRNIGDGELRAILLHELAHIYHGDHLLGLLQRMIKALYWWNPFVYGLCNSLSLAREEVSDNYAISGMESAASYARLLVSLVEKTSLIGRLPCTAGLGTPYELLETRIKKIVSKERDMRVKIGKRMMSLIVLATSLLCGVFIIGSQVAVFGVGPASFTGQKANEPQAAPSSGKSTIVDGKMMLSKMLVHMVDPIYPEMGIKKHVQCRVELEVAINGDGLVSDVRVANGHPLFGDAASTAVKQWKFKPSLIGGVIGGQRVVPGVVVGNLRSGVVVVAPPPPKVAEGGVVPPPKGMPFRIAIAIDFNLDKNDSPKFVISGSWIG